ncbi:MAG: hypothetical protein GY778_27355 [bacterium]|nr:hypothetical protein [bacterium]
MPPPFFTTGEWEMVAPGSEQATGFRLAIRLPPPIEVTNFADLQTIDRTSDVTVTWNPIGYWPSDVIDIQLSGNESVTTGNSTTTGSLSVSCRVPAPDGHLTIPSTMLRDFDPAEPTAFPHPSLSLYVSGPPSEQSRFWVHLTNGESLPGRISHGSWEWIPVTIR